MSQFLRQVTSFCWLDTEHGLHFDIPAMLWEMNVEDTPANREACIKTCREYFSKEFRGLSCEECGHPVSNHTTEGCTYEHGDSYESGFAPMAMGPCGCREWEVEETKVA